MRKGNVGNMITIHYIQIKNLKTNLNEILSSILTNCLALCCLLEWPQDDRLVPDVS